MSHLSLLRDERGSGRQPSTRGHQSLRQNDDGAIMVIGVFMAVVLVGILYYLAGIGNTLLYRERLQDAGDVVSLATAIGHARGMNLIVFINIMMAALVAIVLALKVIELLLTGLVLLLTAISWFFPPAGVAIPIVENARELVGNIHDTAKDIVDELLVVLNGVEQAVKVITPAAAVAAGTIQVSNAYDVAKVAIAIPPRLQLPVEDDTYDRLCVEAEKILSDLIEASVGRIPLIGKVLSAALDGLISAVSLFFCKGEGAQPTYPLEIDRTLPQSEAGRKCEADQSNMQADSQNCSDWDDERDERRPDGEGNCGDGEVLCRHNLSEARKKCQPGGHRENFSYADATAEETVVFNEETWQWETTEFGYDQNSVTLHNVDERNDARGSVTEASGLDLGNEEDNQVIETQEATREREADTSVPCANPPLATGPFVTQEELRRARINHFSEWNIELTDPATGNEKPVCSKRAKAIDDLDTRLNTPPRVDPRTGEPNVLPENFDVGPHEISYPAVKQVYGCSEKAEVTLTIQGDFDTGGAAGGENSDDKVPQKMEEGVELGDGNFQMRGVVFAHGRPELQERKLDISTFGRTPDNESWVGLARGLGRFNVSQAEYYYNHYGSEPDTEWMWNMKWRARLVRFNLGGDDDENEQSASNGGGNGAGGIDIPVNLPTPDIDFRSAFSEKLSAESRDGEDTSGTDIDVLSYLVIH